MEIKLCSRLQKNKINISTIGRSVEKGNFEASLRRHFASLDNAVIQRCIQNPAKHLKHSILDIWQGSAYTSVISRHSTVTFPLNKQKVGLLNEMTCHCISCLMTYYVMAYLMSFKIKDFFIGRLTSVGQRPIKSLSLACLSVCPSVTKFSQDLIISFLWYCTWW